MDTKKVTLIFVDKKGLFEEVRSQISELSFDKPLVVVESALELAEYLRDPKNANRLIVVFIHIDAQNDMAGYESGVKDDILELFPSIITYWITRNSTMVKLKDLNFEPVITYFMLKEKIGKNIILPQLVSDIINYDFDLQIKPKNIEYGIITALFQDEFTEVYKLFDWVKEPENENENETITFHVGRLKGNSKKIVVIAVQNKTGMVDAAIVASIMVERYKPKYLLMPGVCGGVPDLPLGSIVVASGVYTFQRGKVSDYRDKEGNILLKYFDRNNQEIDLTQITDEYKNHIKVNIERFQPENDLIEVTPYVKSRLDIAIPSILEKINEPYKMESSKIKIVFEKMACSSMVIDKSDYFNENILPRDRKTMGVEMESYGIARACQFANEGKTRFIIFKGVMDNTINKDDHAKPQAAYTSALFLKYLLLDNHF